MSKKMTHYFKNDTITPFLFKKCPFLVVLSLFFSLSLRLIFTKIMDITGKIIAILPMQSGEGKNGPWRSQDYVLETQDQYPRKVCFNLFGNRIEQFPLAINDLVNVSFDIESREWNGRWFTTIRAWKVEKAAVSGATVDNADNPYGTPPPPMPPAFQSPDGDEDSGLPF